MWRSIDRVWDKIKATPDACDARYDKAKNELNNSLSRFRTKLNAVKSWTQAQDLADLFQEIVVALQEVRRAEKKFADVMATVNSIKECVNEDHMKQKRAIRTRMARVERPMIANGLDTDFTRWLALGVDSCEQAEAT